MGALFNTHRRRTAADEGMTLVELLIAMVLLTTVIALSTGFLVFAMNNQSKVSQASEANTSNQNGMETLTRVIRQGVYPTGWTTSPTIIQSGSSPTTLIVTSRLSSTGSVDSTVRKYTFTLSGTTLSWQQADLVSCTSAGVCTYGTPTAMKVLMRGVQTSSTVCPANTTATDGPFHYINLDPNTGAPAATGPISTPTTAQLPTISYVTLDFFTQTQTGPRPPACVPLSDYVELRNK